MSDNNWYVVTGGPAVGKSTLLAELEKLGYKTLPEAARDVIDEGLAAGKSLEEVRGDEYQFQFDVLERKVRNEQQQASDELVFFDRGMHDTVAYLRLHDFEINQDVVQTTRQASYKQVFLLEPLEQYTEDYARTESREEALQLNQLLAAAYTEYGLKVVKVPVLPPVERAQFVLDHIKQEQPT